MMFDNNLLLKDDLKKQYILDQNPLTKEFRMLVCDRKTQKIRIYKNKNMICKMFAKCIKECD